MTLHLYFARRFLKSLAGVFAIFLIILVLLDLVEQIRRFDSDAIGFFDIAVLTLLNAPESLYRLLPLIVILATLALFLSLARSSEMVVTRAAGRSALRSLAAPAGVAFLLGAAAVAMFNPIVAATSKQYELASDRFKSGVRSTLSIGRDGLWLRQGSAEGQIVISAERASLDGTELSGVTFLGFDRDGMLDYRIEAARAALTPGAWVLRDAKQWRFAETRNPEAEATVSDSLRVPSDLTRDQIIDSFGTPSVVPIWELPAFIARLEAAGFSARQYRVWLHMELALPVLLTAMVLVGAGFTMRHTRFGRTGIMVLLALALGFTLYFIRNFAQVLGENGQLPVILAAWGPPVAAALLPLGLLLHLEDG